MSNMTAHPDSEAADAIRNIVREEVDLLPIHVSSRGGGGGGTEGGRTYGGQNPLTIHEIYAALTPSDSRSDWASEFAAATCCR